MGIYYAAGFLIGLPYIYYTLDNSNSVDDLEEEWEFRDDKKDKFVSEIEMVPL
jgi:hypothetical protein